MRGKMGQKSRVRSAGRTAAVRSVRPSVLGRAGSGLGVCVMVFLPVGFSAISGCAQQEEEINSFVRAWEASVSSSDYLVQPPDVLEIRSPTAPEIDEQSQVVRQDGKITLPLIGDVKVAGMTPTEIARKLESLLSTYYVAPQVSVRPMGQASKHYYVFGEVTQAGSFPYSGRDTLLHALSLAQPTFIAWRSRIRVIHPSPEEEQRRILTIDAQKMMEEGHLDKNVLLEEGDIIYVPPTPVAWVAMRLREVLWPFTPAAQTIRGPYDAAVDTASADGSDFEHH
jgi:protein involved in polysaccharide export with SLBB domain